MKKILIGVIGGFVFLGAHAQDAQMELTGDPRMACETILCLSTAKNRPAECDPALQRFYSIKRKKWNDTLNARRDFLNLCPFGKDEDATTSALKESIAVNANKCDAEHLNKQTISRTKYICHYASCEAVEYTVISDALPASCQAFANNPYTWDAVARYVGEQERGGHWSDPDNYDADLAAYNKRANQMFNDGTANQ